MDASIKQCAENFTGAEYCQLTPTCKGWGCRHLTTSMDSRPATVKEKAVLFSKVYREAKQKGVLSCPHFRPLSIDERLDGESLESNVFEQKQKI